MRFLMVALMALTALAQAAFVPASDGPVPFRRDKLPVDVDTMSSLSGQLVVLVGAVDVKRPAGSRRAAQLLGLAAALDPANRASRDLAERLAKGGIADASEPKKIEMAKNRTWHLMGWLEQPEAGSDGNALAACLADIMVKLDPAHPRAAELAKKGEQGKWSGWVAELGAFKDEAPALVGDNQPTKSEDPSPPAKSGELKLKSATVQMPIWSTDKVTGMLVLRPTVIKMDARIEGPAPRIRVELPNPNQANKAQQAGQFLTNFLKGRYGSVPKGLILKFGLDGGGQLHSRNGNALTGAMLVLADAALAGVPPEGMVFAEVTTDGSLKLPARFWQTMREIADQEEVTRLILPKQASRFLPPIIVLDKSEFFLSHEVLLASDAGELCDLVSVPPVGTVVEASAIFETIREARGTRSLGSFLNYSSTQQRLNLVMENLPAHASARMLALRGSSQWPKRLTRDIYAREIRAALAPMRAQFRKGGWANVKASDLDAVADESRDQLERVEKLYGSVSDREELHEPAVGMVKGLQRLVAEVKRSEPDRNLLQPIYKETWTEYAGVIARLTEAAGDGDEYPLPPLDWLD